MYSFLKRCENRKTHQCWPSIRTIGEAVRMSENTVRKYIRQLEERGLITTEPTEVITKIQEVIDEYYDRQLEELELATERQRVVNLLLEQKPPVGRCVAPFGAGRVPAPPGGFGADLARCSTAVEEAYPGNLPPHN